MGRQIGSSQSPPSFRSTDLALPLFPGSCMRKPFTRHNPETPMPLAPATLSRSKKLTPAPAASLPTQPALHLRTDSAPPVLEIRDRRFPHAPALSQFVLVKRTPAWDRVSGWVQSRCSGVRKDLSPSVLVKRADLALGRCPPAFDQRLRVECWPGNGSEKRVVGLRSAVVGMVRQARHSVLVKSFSGSCAPPLPLPGNPGAGAELNESEVRRA